MAVGSVVFGPVPTTAEMDAWRRNFGSMKLQANLAASAAAAHSCHCMGPQPGQTKCPCVLRGESEKGAKMIRDGVVIDGVHYDLVRRDQD